MIEKTLRIRVEVEKNFKMSWPNSIVRNMENQEQLTPCIEKCNCLSTPRYLSPQASPMVQQQASLLKACPWASGREHTPCRKSK